MDWFMDFGKPCSTEL